MIVLLQLIAIGLFALIGLQAYNALRSARRHDRQLDDETSGVTIDQTPEDDSRRGAQSGDGPSPAKTAAQTLREFENARSELKARYPSTFAMFGGYLNDHTMSELGSIEAAVKDMIADWSPRRDEISRELTKMLAENDNEEELRAIVVAACDARFDEEGYRAWLTWLLGRFNALGSNS